MERAEKAVVVILCQWEVVAVTTGRIPPITAWNRRCPWVGRAILAALAWHFRSAVRETAADVLTEAADMIEET